MKRVKGVMEEGKAYQFSIKIVVWNRRHSRKLDELQRRKRNWGFWEGEDQRKEAMTLLLG